MFTYTGRGHEFHCNSVPLMISLNCPVITVYMLTCTLNFFFFFLSLTLNCFHHHACHALHSVVAYHLHAFGLAGLIIAKERCVSTSDYSFVSLVSRV